MKRIFTLLLVITSYAVSAQSTLIHYWNFNATAAITDTAVLFKPTLSLVNGASLNYAGTGAVTSFAFASGALDTTNERLPEPDPTVQNYIKVASPYGTFTWNFSTTGFKDIVVKYAIYSSSKGSKINTIAYTLDGIKWDSANLVITHVDHGPAPTTTTNTGAGTYYLSNTTGISMDLVILDFSAIKGANNNPKFQVQTNYDVAAAGNDRYNNLSVEGTPIAVPVILNSFKASVINSVAKLTWSATNELNIKSYQVQRSLDNKTYTTIATVAAKNAAGLATYTAADAIATGTQYYRLQITDNSGRVSYSATVVVSGRALAASLTAFPDPAVNTITLSHQKAVTGSSINITSADGKLVNHSTVQTEATQTSIDVSRLTKGNYIVTYSNNGKTETTQFIK